jgi:transglutaminase-like putative cysteine protease
MEKPFEQLNKRNIDQDEGKKPFEGEKPEKQEKFSEELKAYQREGQEMIDSYRKFFMTYAKDVSLNFKMSDGFYIDLKNGVVHLDTKWFAEKAFSKEQILWATLNQLSIFSDIAADPDGFKNRLARESDSGKLQKPYKLLREAVDQIYRKKLIDRKAPSFEEGAAGYQEVRRLYQEKLAPDRDLTSLPLHLQFINALIRSKFVPDEEVIVNEEVKNALASKIKFIGKEYTPQEILNQLIEPKVGRDTKAGQRYLVLENTIQKTFLGLLEKDLENESKGRDLTQEIDSELPPQEQDEYFPQDMESREGTEKQPYIFKITPGKTGYYRGGVRTRFDKNTLRWMKGKQTVPYSEPVSQGQHSYVGKVCGFVSLPLPENYAIDSTSLQSSGPVKILRDQFGAFYAKADKVQHVSFRFGPKGFLERSSPDEFTDSLFDASLSPETERFLNNIAGLSDNNDKADKIVQYIRSTKSYNVQAQGQLYNTSKGADNYFQNIDQAKELECYTANTFFVGLCRRVGIPARLITGHFISKKDKEGITQITRNTGHAWSEIWDGGAWILKDATPPGSGEGYGNDYDNAEQNNPDQIDPEEIKDWLDKHEEDKKKEEEQKAKEKEEENKTAEQKAQEAQEKMDNEWCEKHNISRETLQQYRKIEAEVAPYLEDLSRLWQRIIFGSTRKIERGKEGYFKAGTELDLPKVIEEFPKIQKGKLEEVRIFKKITQKEVLIRKPELIRVRLVGDMSGSMDSAKLHTLQQCFVLLLSSIREFNTYLNLTRSQTKSKLETDTEAWIFGDNAERVKRLRSESGYDDEQAEIIKIFEKLQNTIGGTYDNEALEAIFNSLTPEDREKIGQEKIMEMVFEITDGGSSAPDAARKAVDELSESGVIARAFQIGAVSDGEKKTFNDVWNKNREEKLGEIVGEKIENLLPAVTELLKKYLGNVRL